MSLGIERNEKCLYIFDDRTQKEVIEAFEGFGFDVEEFLESGQFEFLTKSESYLKGGRFDPDKMINLLCEAKEDALEEGYHGLRATGEMTWFLIDMPGVKRLMEYESKLNEFVPDNKVIALCQYNEERFSPEVLVNVLRTHPMVLIYDDLHENLYYLPPRIFTAQMKGEIIWEYYESMKENIFQRTHLKRDKFLNSFLRHGIRDKAIIIRGYQELLKYYDSIEEAKPIIEKSDNTSRDIIKMANKVSDILKVHDIEVEEISVNSVLDFPISKGKTQASERGIEIKYEKTNCWVKGGSLLETLFYNLIENSIIHSNCSKIRITTKKENDECVVSVEDDGKGIPDDVRENIFEIGYKKGKSAGSGLGLYLVKEIAEVYGGQVEVEDSELGGARFDVHLKKV